MAKFCGEVGYGETVESPPGSGVWKQEFTEIEYFGDILDNTRRTEEGEKVNDDFALSNSVSIVADAYANGHFFAIKYVRWMGALWTVQSVKVQSPRLILRLGGVYNGRSLEKDAVPGEAQDSV